MKNRKFSITTDLSEGILYFIEKIAETKQLEAVVIQTSELEKTIIKSFKRFITNLIVNNRFFKKNKYGILKANLANFNYLHIVDGEVFNKLRTLARKYQFDIYITNNINNDSVLQDYLRQTKVDFMLGLGGKVIKPLTLKLFHGIWINGHGGVLPDYRGLSSEYWAVKNKQYHMIGCTIHNLTEKIDSGKIIKISKIPYVPTEAIEDLALRNHANLILTYIEVAKNLISIDPKEVNENTSNSNANYIGKYYTYPKNNFLRKITRTKVKDI